MPSPNRPVPATLESLYRIAIKDTLDQSLGRRNADDIQDVRQSLAALDKTLAHQRLAIDALENENRALKTANEKLSTAVDKLLVSQEQQATMGKTAMRTLQQHVLQVDQRQSELETKYDEIERAFEQTAQLMQPSIEEEASPPAPSPPWQQQHQQLHGTSSDSRDEAMGNVGTGIDNGHVPAISGQSRGPPNEEEIPLPRDHEERWVQTRSSHHQADRRIHASPPLPQSPRPPRRDAPADPGVDQWQHVTNVSGKQQTVNYDSTAVNPRRSALNRHYKETKRKYAEAGKMSSHKERQFIWDFIDGIKDEETRQWIQQALLDNLPSNMVCRRRKKGGARYVGRLIALDLNVTWEAVANLGLKRAYLPPFLL